MEQSPPAQPLNDTQTIVPPTTEKPLFFYGKRIPQEGGVGPGFMKMDADIYLQGEVIRFYVINEGNSSLGCNRWPPYYLYQQVGTWELLTKEPSGNSGYTYAIVDNLYPLEPDESTEVEQLNTADLEPGHYKIVKCGVAREFEIHAALKNTTTSR